ncbi:hypothetical protein QR680_016498 [Steinernema hermaphroditum]|uniref:Uncharacterized protein n=1 Tax=Steinernema hermaphroditum TaxID=289476 RepID=A0AA39HBE7_9BILA|nr:hypothetical protein QR680_016498 [Steinernema hermaphroditum]
MKDKWLKLTSTLGILLHLLFVAIPLDLVRWLTLKRKDVRGKVVVITGGASGLGQRMAEILAIDLGANVVIVDIDKDKAEQAAKTINEQHGHAFARQCDISDDLAMTACGQQIERSVGAVDVVICNAAVLSFGHLMELSTKQLKMAMDVNIMGTINTIRAFLPSMEERNVGQIVAISSIAGFYGETYGMAYCPTKFAVRGIMECLQMELRDRGVEGVACTTVCPYFARTPMILNMGMRPTSRQPASSLSHPN